MVDARPLPGVGAEEGHLRRFRRGGASSHRSGRLDSIPGTGARRMHANPRTVRQGAPAQPAASESSASSTLAGWSAAFATRRQRFAIVPSGPTMTVDRITPTVFFPYIIFSPQAP